MGRRREMVSNFPPSFPFPFPFPFPEEASSLPKSPFFSSPITPQIPKLSLSFYLHPSNQFPFPLTPIQRLRNRQSHR